MEIKLPSLGEGAASGTVVGIRVKEGDTVDKDQTLMEIESDKAVAEMPSPEAGVIEGIRVKEGDEVSEGDVLAVLTVDESDGNGGGDAGEPEDGGDAEDEGSEDAEADAQDKGGSDSGENGTREGRAAATGASDGGGGKGARAPAAPSVRRIADELGIDLSEVGGSGRGGRTMVEDLRAYVALLKKRAEEAAERGGGFEAAPETPDPAEFGEVDRERLSGIRKAIARRLLRTWPRVPQVTQFGEADIAALMRMKKKRGKDFEEKGVKLTLTALLLKILPPLLREHPFFNASLDLENGEVLLKRYHHIGVAVDTEDGLVVPVIRDVDRKSLPELSEALSELAGSARDGGLSKEAMEGGSFTLSNQGGFGGGAFTPLVRYPESAILGVGRAAERPVKTKSTVTTHPFLPLALSYDHRLIDGGQAARFMADLVGRLEDPDADTLFEGG